MNNHNIIVLGIVGIVLYAIANQQAAPPLPDNDTITAPSDQMQVVVKPIKVIRQQNPQAASRLADFYHSAADVVKRDSTKITTTQQVRDWLIDADTLFLQKTDLVGSIQGFGAAKDKALADTIGLDSRAVDEATRQRLVDVLNAIAWALKG